MTLKPEFRSKTKEKCGVIKDVSNKLGYCSKPNKLGNVMFYPDGGNPYRVCLKKEEVELLN